MVIGFFLVSHYAKDIPIFKQIIIQDLNSIIAHSLLRIQVKFQKNLVIKSKVLAH